MHDDSKKKFLKELLAASETVLQKDHPNPNRVGCPDHAVLQRLADFSEEQIAPEPDVIRHVTECFPCFRALREMRRQRKT
jgi:hypothetical protein